MPFKKKYVFILKLSLTNVYKYVVGTGRCDNSTSQRLGTETVANYSFLEKYDMFPCSFHSDFRDWVLPLHVNSDIAEMMLKVNPPPKKKKTKQNNNNNNNNKNENKQKNKINHGQFCSFFSDFSSDRNSKNLIPLSESSNYCEGPMVNSIRNDATLPPSKEPHPFIDIEVTPSL